MENTTQPGINDTQTTSVNPVNKTRNIFKYLFIITFIILLVVTSYLFFILKEKKQKEISIKTENSQTQETPTDTITPSKPKDELTEENATNIISPTKKSLSYQAKSIQDDSTKTTKLILTDQNNNETIIKSEIYTKMANNTLKPNYDDFVFSPDYSFLFYNYSDGYEGFSSSLFDIKNKKNIILNISVETKGYTMNSKYFYGCAEGGMMPGGAVVINLSDSTVIFDSKEGESFSCSYDQTNKKVFFNKLDLTGTNNVTAKYEFSETTGKVTKTK